MKKLLKEMVRAVTREEATHGLKRSRRGWSVQGTKRSLFTDDLGGENGQAYWKKLSWGGGERGKELPSKRD